MSSSFSRLRIGVDARVLTHGRYGGVGEYTVRLQSEMASIAPHHEFHLFINAARRYSGDFFYSLPSNCVVHSFRIPNKALSFSHKFFNKPFCDNLIGGVDVWWSPHFLPTPVSCPKVVTVHDLSFLYYPELFDLKRRIWHAFINPRHEAESAQKIIAVSQSTREDLKEKWGIPSDKIEVIYSGIGNDLHRVEDVEHLERVRQLYNLPQKFILFLGVVEPRKNLEGLARAYEHMRSLGSGESTDLVIAGNRGWSSRSLFETIRMSPYRNNIHLIGFVESADKAALYSLADLFVYPSFFEGFGFPPLEAMACGTPVVVSHTTSLPEIVQDAGVLVDPLRLEEIAFAMNEVLRDETLRATLREKGLVQAKKFQWEETARRTISVLEKTAKNKKNTE